jgi:hypothetical protein
MGIFLSHKWQAVEDEKLTLSSSNFEDSRKAQEVRNVVAFSKFDAIF